MQRKPISPLEGLPEIIQKAGSDILSGMQQAGAAKAAQAQKEKALGDAVLAKIDITPPKAKPEQAAEFSNYVQQDVVPLITDYQAGKISAATFNEKARDVIYNLQERRNKYAQDLEAFELAEKPETKQNFYTDDFDSFVAGTPDRVEVVEPEFPMNAPYKEKSMLSAKQGMTVEDDINARYDEELSKANKEMENVEGVLPEEAMTTRVDIERDIERRRQKELSDNKNRLGEAVYRDGELKEEPYAKPERRIVAGMKGYLSLPFEEQKKIDVKSKLQESLVPKTVGAQKAFGDYSPNFKPESMITIHKDKRGVITAERDEPLIQRNRDLYVMSILSRESYGENHDIEKRAIARTAIQKMERDNVPEEQRAELLPEYMGVIAASSFDRMVNTTEEYEKRKTNEEMLKSQWGNIYYTSGGGESKKDNYVDEESYNTDLVARSTYENVIADKEFDKYISDPKKDYLSITQEGKKYSTKLEHLSNKYRVKSTDREALKEAWIKETKGASKVYKGKTVEEGWVEQTKRDLARYEGLPAISFNNKTAKNVELEDDGKFRQFIPDKVIYNKDGSIKGIEAHAAVQGKDGSYVKKPQSLQVIPITERNFEALKGGFPELFKYAKGRGVNLSYTDGKKAEGKGAETKKDNKNEERIFGEDSYTLEELKYFGKKHGKTDKEIEELWKTLK
jgi:hypothetical protein